MSLYENLPYKEYLKVLSINSDACVQIAKAAHLGWWGIRPRVNPEVSHLNIDNGFPVEKFDGLDLDRYRFIKAPAKLLLKDLDKRGVTVEQFNTFLEKTKETSLIKHYDSRFRPSTKFAILIGNRKYDNLQELVTTGSDCDKLGNSLRALGFMVVVITNLVASKIKVILEDIFSTIPPAAYCFFYYAGHGFELCGAKYAIGTDWPADDPTIDYAVSESFILQQMSKCKPELCIALFDMCRTTLDRDANPKLYANVPKVEEYTMNCNLIVGYSTSPFMPTFEKVVCEDASTTLTQSQFDCTTMPSSAANAVSTNRDMDSFADWRNKSLRYGMSVYAFYLYKHLTKDLDFTEILECVHRDMIQEKRQSGECLQKPQKLDNIVSRRFLSDDLIGNQSYSTFRQQISEILQKQDYHESSEISY